MRLHGDKGKARAQDGYDGQEQQGQPGVHQKRHHHGEDKGGGSPHGNAYEHLEGVLEVRHIGGEPGDDAAGGKLVDV